MPVFHFTSCFAPSIAHSTLTTRARASTGRSTRSFIASKRSSPLLPITGSRRSGAKAAERQPEVTEVFPKPVLLEFLSRSDGELNRAAAAASSAGRAEIESVIERARARLIEIAREIETSAQVSAENIERDLDAIDRMILRSAMKCCGEEEIERIKREAESQLQPYRKKMDKAIYEQTVHNFILRRLREMNDVARLSLFYT